MTETSYEAWILMSLVYRNLDDEDASDALMLAERLYGIDKTNSFNVFLYAKCLFRQLDYMASYSVLIKQFQNDSVPCLYLFAKSCLELGNLEEDISDKRHYWEQGIEALQKALELMSQEHEGEEVYWGDELSSVTTRQHIPSIASVHLLLGDLYVNIDHMRPASIHYKACLDADPFKLSAFIRLCDIAPDCFPLSNQVTASFFKPIPSIHISKRETITTTATTASSIPNKTSTKRRKHQNNLHHHNHHNHHNNLLSSFLPSLPNPNIQDISLVSGREEEYELNSFDLPRLRNVFHKTTLHELRAVATRGSLRPANSFDVSERDDIEKKKDEIISEVEADIFEMKRSEAYKNKHGLHKKPPVVVPRKLKIDLLDVEEEEEEKEEENEDDELSIHNNNNSKGRSISIDKGSPPRSVTFKNDDNNDDNNDGHVRKKHKAQHKKKHDHVEKNNGPFPYEDNEEAILKAMNTILGLFQLLANAYMYQSLNECRQTTVQLQRLDDGQYSTPWVVSMIGKAYYNSGDYNTASLFFDYNFVKAPWYCENIPFYTTSLWYLEKKYELNLVAFKMKENKCHKYEAYIAAGNWTKSVGRANETIDWFKKAVEYDPSRYYGYALLGYEELEKEDYLAAKEYFTACMIANKRSYLGWYGLAKAYQGLRTYDMAKTLLEEAVRLHPRHHVILSTMAEVLMELQEYDEALQFIHSSLKVHPRRECTELQQKILQLKEIADQKEELQQQQQQHLDYSM